MLLVMKAVPPSLLSPWEVHDPRPAVFRAQTDLATTSMGRLQVRARGQRLKTPAGGRSGMWQVEGAPCVPHASPPRR